MSMAWVALILISVWFLLAALVFSLRAAPGRSDFSDTSQARQLTPFLHDHSRPRVEED